MSLYYAVNNWTERVTKGVRSIDTDHAYIHEGLAFEVSSITTAFVGTVTYSLTPSTAPTKYVHLRPANISLEKDSVVFQIWEGTTNTSTGLTLTAYNRNRLSSVTSELTFTGADGSSFLTTTGGAVKIHERKIFGGTGPGQAKAGAEAGQPLEWVLDSAKKYAFALVTTAAAEVGVNFFWYEEGDA